MVRQIEMYEIDCNMNKLQPFDIRPAVYDYYYRLLIGYLYTFFPILLIARQFVGVGQDKFSWHSWISLITWEAD